MLERGWTRFPKNESTGDSRLSTYARRFYRAIRSHDAGQGIRFRVTDEQLLAGLHMFRGSVVQMNAGEGKTVAAAFPAVLHALFGGSVHIITANDYLADRDAALLGAGV